MVKRAKFIRAIRNKYSAQVDMLYEYRGYEYWVTDMHNGYSETTAEQHIKEQKAIDEKIAYMESDKYVPVTDENHPQSNSMSLDEIWEVMGWD